MILLKTKLELVPPLLSSEDFGSEKTPHPTLAYKALHDPPISTYTAAASWLFFQHQHLFLGHGGEAPPQGLCTCSLPLDYSFSSHGSLLPFLHVPLDNPTCDCSQPP